MWGHILTMKIVWILAGLAAALRRVVLTRVASGSEGKAAGTGMVWHGHIGA
jgi:hypothetical protein